MFVDTYMHFTLRGIGLRSLAESYASWILGHGDRPRVRQDRLDDGVDPSWTVERLLAAEHLVGAHGCRADVRLAEKSLVVRFVHRDREHAAVLWHTVARATRRDDEWFEIEHGVGRDAPRDYALYPIAAAPRVVTSLIDREGVEVAQRQLRLPLTTLQGGDVKGWIDHELLNPDRTVPFVVISCAPPQAALSALDVEKVSKRLRGLAAVVYLATPQATWELTQGLAAHGYGDEFRCFNGAAHLYGPTQTLRDDHRTWLADRLLSAPPEHRVDRLAGYVAGRAAVRGLPPGFFTRIEEHDRAERRRLAEALATRAKSTPPSETKDVGAYAARLEAECAELRVALKAAVVREQEYAEAWNQSEDTLRDATRARDDSEARLEQEQAVSASLREQLGRRKTDASSGLPADVVSAIRALGEEKHTPEQCLTLISEMYPERIVVLDSAFASAKRARGFRFTDKLFPLLCRLGDDYHQALCGGRGDAEAASVFGGAFAAKESEGTMSNSRAREERTFEYSGRKLLMWPHLKIGAKESVAETIRVHFAWVAEEQKIVIGWCGEHRHRVGG